MHLLSKVTSTIVAHRVCRTLMVAVMLLSLPQCVAPAQRVLTVIARDTALEVSSTVPAGITTVRLALQGKVRRELVVHRVPAGTTPETLIRGAAGRPARWFAQWSFGGPAVPRDSATDASATLDLRPGRYVLVAYEVDETGRARGDRFLWQPFTAIAASVLISGRFPVPDLTVKVRDARIDVLGAMRPGQRTIQVENVGARPHELIIARLKPGKTIDDVRRWERDRAGAAPFVYVGGVTPMSGGMTAQTRLVFQTGVHVVFCPMRDGRDRSADHEHGVLTTFKVG